MSNIPRWVGLANTRPLLFEAAGHVTTNRPRKVDFGLSGWWWVGFEGEAVLMPNGTKGRVHEARLHRSGWVVGLRDLTTCDHYGDAVLSEEWRGSLADRIEDEIRG